MSSLRICTVITSLWKDVRGGGLSSNCFSHNSSMTNLQTARWFPSRLFSHIVLHDNESKEYVCNILLNNGITV